MKDPVRENFKNFVYLVWKHLNMPDPTPVQYDICDFLQHGNKRRMVQAYRGVGKSWLAACYCLWRLYNDIELKIMIVSASQERADAFSVFMKSLIHNMPMLNHLAPEKGQRDSNLKFDIANCKPAQAPSVKSVGITGQITGSRANIIVADDIETLNNSLTQLNRDRLSEAVKEFDAVLVPEGKTDIIYLGTPQTEMSIYNLLPDRGYQRRIWTARYPKNINNYNGQLADMITDAMARDASLVGQPVDPQRFDDEDLIEREASYGRTGFSLQFMLDTTLSDADRYPLKLSDLIVMDLDKELAPARVAWASGVDNIAKDLDPVGLTGDRFHNPMFYSKDEMIPYSGSVMSIDPSGRGSDETGYAVVKMCNGKMFVTESGGLKGGYSEETLKTLANIAKDNKVNYIVIESNFGDGMFSEIFKPVLKMYHPCTIEEVRHSVQKERRIIDTLEPVMNQHRLVVDKRIVKEDKKKEADYQLFYQMTRITLDRGSIRHDDALDALSIAVNYWVEAMARGEEDAYKDYLEDMKDKEIEKFLKNFEGRQERKTWMETW